MILIRGEAGIGKSRLVTEWLAKGASDEWRVLTGRCVPIAGADLPYGPFIGALRDASRQVGMQRIHVLAGPRAVALEALLPGLTADPTSSVGDVERYRSSRRFRTCSPGL